MHSSPLPYSVKPQSEGIKILNNQTVKFCAACAWVMHLEEGSTFVRGLKCLKHITASGCRQFYNTPVGHLRKYLAL